MNVSLREYLQNAWIRVHETSSQEIRDLLAVVDRDIHDSQTPSLSPEWRFDIAYNAVLQAATAALAAAGYRAERSTKHLRTLETLAFTVGLEQGEVAYLDVCRRKRHVAVYERVGVISDGEAEELVTFAEEVRERTRAWLRRSHPTLAP